MVPLTLRRLAGRLSVRLLLVAALTLGAAGAAHAQLGGQGDDPTAHNNLPAPQQTESQDSFSRVTQAICWYIPNRIMDIADIFRIHVSAGDGNGVSLRATDYFLWASYFEDNAYCFGWSGKPRQSPFFGEQVEERHFSFLAAKEGELKRDPTEVGISAHLLIVGFNIAVSLGEALDAVTGIVGVDLEGDDHGPVMFDYTKTHQPPPMKTSAASKSSAKKVAARPAKAAPQAKAVAVATAPAAGASDAPPAPLPWL